MEWIIFFSAFCTVLIVAGLIADAISVWRLEKLLDAEENRRWEDRKDHNQARKTYD